MFGLAALIAGVAAVLGGLLDFWSKSDSYDSYSYRSRSSSSNSNHVGGTVTAAIVSFILLLFINWGILFWTLPVWSGAGWVFLITVNLIVLAVVFGIANYAGQRISAAPVVSVLAIIVLIAGVVGIWNNWFLGQDNVDKMKSEINVTVVNNDDATKNYPKTSDEHIVIVGDQAARFRANAVMSNQGIGTRYVLGDGELQAIKGHMYYVFDLRVDNWTNSKAVNYTVPGYVLVDAEDPNAQAQPKLGYKITLWPGGYFQSNLERHVYNNGYSGYFVEGLSLETDDEGRPFYTASINKPVVRWQTAMPEGFITVDAQTGKIVRYPLDRVPAWVDRVYSESNAKTLIEWWGHWGNAPYKWINEGSNNRYKVSGDLNIVYTDEGPAYQALLTSWNSDTAVQYVVLMSTRSNKATAYKAPQGLLVETTVDNSFNKSPNNIKRNDPTGLALHKIYGQLTWVASMVGDGEGGQKDDNDRPKAASFAGVGLLNATQSDSGRVIIGRDKGDALSQYSTQIATGSNNNNPEANAQNKTIEGKIASVSPPLVFNGNTFMIFTLEGDKDHLYRGQVTETATSLTMTVTKIGDPVVITYVDTGNPIRNISSFTNNSLVGVK